MELHHLAFRTQQIKPLRAFYERVLGLRFVRETPAGSVWLQVGQAVLMLEAMMPEEPGILSGSMEFIAFRVSDAEKEALRVALQAHAVAIENETQHTLYFRDPDGRRVGVSTYPL